MQGISIYERKGRPTFYVAYDCPVRARRVCESSGIMVTDHRGKIEAYAYAREKSMSGVTHGQARDASRWENWVEPWLRLRYANQPSTLTSYMGAWKFIALYLREKSIPTPRALTYEHVVRFVLWREAHVKKQSGRKVSRNTALHNVKVLSRVMRHAVRLAYASGNPCVRISEDVRPTPAKEKPEFTNEQIAIVRAELARPSPKGTTRPEWMSIAFEIALHQNCRLRATQIPMERIDLDRGTIQFHEKGSQVFTVPIHPGLRPLLTQFKADGRKITCQLPLLASRTFSRMLRRIGLPHTFHSTRVTGITRFARAGVAEQQAMAYVNHGGWAVHRVYQRLKPADVVGCHAALDFSGAAAPTLGSPRTSGAPRASAKPSRASNSGRKKSAPPSPGLRATG